MRDPEALHLLAAPVLIELEHFMIMQATQGSPLLAMWATHDTTILVFLAALGVWDGQWPPYTDTVVLEVYKEKLHFTVKRVILQVFASWSPSGVSLV